MIEALQYTFFTNALLAGFLASIACGIIGSYVVVKRISALTGGISHSAFGGVGIGYFLGVNPLIGATAFSLLSALSIGWVTKKYKQREDTLIAGMWSFGMAVGVLFIYLTPGYSADLFSWLFGNILLITQQDLLLMGLLNITIVTTVVASYDRLLAISFDEEYAETIGLPVKKLYLLLLCLIALTIVVLIRVVGIILLIALMTLPAATAGLYTKNLKKMMAAATLLGVATTTSGIWLSYILDLPAGAIIILLTTTIYFTSLLLKREKNQ
jgi:zinc transport system permease protein